VATEVEHPLFARFAAFLASRETDVERDYRRETLAGLRGRVLEIGSGSGPNFPYYPESVTELVSVEPEPNLRAKAEEAARAVGRPVRVVDAVAERLPFEDGSFDVVMSSIGAMFAPHHQDVADELVRVCSPGGTIGMLNWTPEGMIGALFRLMGPFAPPPPPGAQPPPLWGSEDHIRELFGDRVELHTLQRDMLDITAFEHPNDYGEHFKERYGPTIVARRNAVQNGREEEFDQAFRDFCDEWNLGTPDDARFEQEYLVAVGTRA
jgi:SAM-dependent methyltransferase